MSCSAQIKNFVQKVERKTTNIYQRACNQVSLDIAEGSPVSTGTLLGSWAPSNGTPSSHNYVGGQSAWQFGKKNKGKKNKGIADQNKAAALANVSARIKSTTETLSKQEPYYFTNDVSYIQQAEHEGWSRTEAYHMRENAILNWNAIVANEVGKA